MKIKEAVNIINELEKVDDLITNIMNERNVDELIDAKDSLRIAIEKIKEIEL
jgi:hypothetical protein